MDEQRTATAHVIQSIFDDDYIDNVHYATHVEWELIFSAT